MRRLRHRRSDRFILILLVVVGIGLFFCVQFGRGVMFMRRVDSFVNGIDEMPPAEVKRKVQEFVRGLDSRSTVVQQGSLMALKVATNWDHGSDRQAWKKHWAEEEPFWEYRLPSVMNVAPKPENDWRKLLPPQP